MVDINEKWPLTLIQVYYRLYITWFVVVIFSLKIHAPYYPSSTHPLTENPRSATAVIV